LLRSIRDRRLNSRQCFRALAVSSRYPCDLSSRTRLQHWRIDGRGNRPAGLRTGAM